MAGLKIALAQVNPAVGDLVGNVARLAGAAGRARSAGAGLVVFPELALSGCPAEGLLLRADFLRDCRAALEGVVTGCRGLAAVVGFPEADGGRVYNAAALVQDGRVASVYRKRKLADGVLGEKRLFSAGRRALVFEAGGLKVALALGEEPPAGKGAKLVVNPAALPFSAGAFGKRRDGLARRAKRARAHIASCNLVGGQDGLVFDGGSMVLDAKGKLRASAKRFEEEILLVELGADGSAAGPAAAAPGECEEIWAALALGTRDYARKNGFTRAVLGLSGGVDSALVACLAADALGPKNVTAVTSPSPCTSEETLADARRVAERMGIELVTIPIDPVVQASLEALREAFGRGAPDAGRAAVAAENLQARVRANLLMALANRFGWLVLASGNRSEGMAGYCTLYGDTAGGFAPLKDVLKTEVYALAQFLNERAGCERIPKSVLERPPTAELAPGQTDEDALGPYARLDPVLRAYLEEGASEEEVAARGFEASYVRGILRRVARSEFKRRQSPPGVRVRPELSAPERRLPVTNGYRGWRGAPGASG